MLNPEEVEAANAILDALGKLDDGMKERVMLFVLGRLGAPAAASSGASSKVKHELPAGDRNVHDIRALKDLKSPSTAIEMATLVAYYLSDLAPEEERRKEIKTADLEKYFKQAQFPLPNVLNMVLPRASEAGYFEQLGRGTYRLNPVGYNLAVHSLPSATGKRAGARGQMRSRQSSPTAKRETSKKKGAATASRRR